MKNPEDIISDTEIERVHRGFDFGSMEKRQVVNQGVLKCACGFSQGSTPRYVCEELGLISDSYTLTPKGSEYLWAVFFNETKNLDHI